MRPLHEACLYVRKNLTFHLWWCYIKGLNILPPVGLAIAPLLVSP